MAVAMERESTEYIYVGITGNVPATGVEMAFLTAGVRPTSPDWETAVLIGSDVHALWNEAVASGVTGDYFAACLIGAFGGGTVTLSAGDYQVWLRITDTTEQPVKIAPVVLTVN
jgi:hypothetical protein